MTIRAMASKVQVLKFIFKGKLRWQYNLGGGINFNSPTLFTSLCYTNMCICNYQTHVQAVQVHVLNVYDHSL